MIKLNRNESFFEIRFRYDDLAEHLRPELKYEPTDEQLIAFADIVRRQLREDVTKRGNITIQTIAEEKAYEIDAILEQEK